jgi:transcriptional regulator with XRE-family HTH domain
VKPVDKITLGERLRAARVAAGFRQEDFASEIGVGQPAVSAWESGTYAPRSNLWPSIAGTLGVDLVTLFFDVAAEAG